MNKKIASIILIALMLLSFTACNGNSNNSLKSTTSDSYTVGISQLVQHAALDAATEGFKDALIAKLGDKVIFDEQNASGDPATCAVISNQ